jgi:hypothetical protein
MSYAIKIHNTTTKAHATGLANAKNYRHAGMETQKASNQKN